MNKICRCLKTNNKNTEENSRRKVHYQKLLKHIDTKVVSYIFECYQGHIHLQRLFL